MTTRKAYARGRGRWHGWLPCCTCVVAIVLAISAPNARAAAPSPSPATFTLAPDTGPCGRTVTASGSGYLPGTTVDVRGPFVPGTAINLAGRSGVPQPRVAVGADGTFTTSLLPCTAATEGAERPGTAYLWTAETVESLGTFADASFTVAPTTIPGLPNTGGGAAARRHAPGVPLALGALLLALGASVATRGYQRGRAR